MIQTADEWLKKQGNSVAPTTAKSGSIISAEDFLKNSKIPSPSQKQTQSVTPDQSKKQSMWGEGGAKQSLLKDLPLIGETALGIIPGGKYLWETKNQPLDVGQTGKAIGSDLAGMAKGIAGLPVRLGLSLTDLFGGPRKADIPFIGEQTSPQESARQLKASGSGPLASGLIPATQFLFDALMAKGGVKAVKNKLITEPQARLTTQTAQGMLGMKEPVKPQLQLPSGKKPLIPEPVKNYTELPQSLMGKPNKVLPQFTKEEPYITRGEPVVERIMSQEKSAIPKPSQGDVQTTQILDKLVKPGVAKENIGTKLAKLNPFRFESGKIESYGPAGKEIVTRGRRAFSRSVITAGEFRKLNEQTGMSKLPLNELNNFRDVMEGKAQPISPKVSELVSVWKPVMEKYGSQSDVQMVENYFPRRLSEAGRKFYELPENKEGIIQAIMKDRGIDRAKAVNVMGSGLKKGSFEFERVLKDVSPEMRKTPLEELYAWQNEVARRTGVIQEFGKKDEIASRLLSKLGKDSKYEMQQKAEAQTYIDRVAGRVYNVSELDPIYNFLKGSMVVSKLNPLTTISNELQGHINSWLQYGDKGLADATFGKGGNKLVKELGLDTLKGKIGDEVVANSWATKWMKIIGMEGSEVRGFGRTAQSTYGAINRAFESLKKNPSDVKSYKLLKEHGMFIDDLELAKAIKEGKIPDIEMKLGLVEGVRQKMFFQAPGERPTWANSGAGSASYTFKNYVLSQMQLLAKAPVERQLAYTMVLAPILGLPVLALRRAIQGKPLPDNPSDLYVESASSGPGTPFDIYKSATNKDFLLNTILGGFGPVADIATAPNKPKALIKATVPFSSLFLNRLFPPKQ